MEKLYAIAKLFGAPLSERVIRKGEIVYDEYGEDYPGTPYYDGKDIATRREDLPMTEHEVLHEIAHWVVASDDQRRLPEYGLGYIALKYQANSVPVLPEGVGGTQEMITWVFCLLIGREFGLSPALPDLPVISWDEYLAVKRGQEPGFAALFEEWAPIFLGLLGRGREN